MPTEDAHSSNQITDALSPIANTVVEKSDRGESISGALNVTHQLSYVEICLASMYPQSISQSFTKSDLSHANSLSSISIIGVKISYSPRTSYQREIYFFGRYQLLINQSVAKSVLSPVKSIDPVGISTAIQRRLSNPSYRRSKSIKPVGNPYLYAIIYQIQVIA